MSRGLLCHFEAATCLQIAAAFRLRQTALPPAPRALRRTSSVAAVSPGMSPCDLIAKRSISAYLLVKTIDVHLLRSEERFNPCFHWVTPLISKIYLAKLCLAKLVPRLTSGLSHPAESGPPVFCRHCARAADAARCRRRPLGTCEIFMVLPRWVLGRFVRLMRSGAGTFYACIFRFCDYDKGDT